VGSSCSNLFALAATPSIECCDSPLKGMKLNIISKLLIHGVLQQTISRTMRSILLALAEWAGKGG
jgi:hypothetical protein